MKRRTIALLALAVLTYGLHAQSAVVFSLTAKESEAGARLYLRMNEARDAYDAYVEKMGAKYLKKEIECTAPWCNGLHDKASFSADFKHVLPVTEPRISNGWAGACITPTGSSITTSDLAIPAYRSLPDTSKTLSGTSLTFVH